MNKSLIVMALIASSLLMSCRTTVRTPKTSTDVKVGSIHHAEPDHDVKSGRI